MIERAPHKAVAGDKEHEPLVSVVIPAFNAAPWIGETLASVLAQDHRPLDVVVVDDGSTDNTAAAATGAAGSDPRVRVLSFPNGGLACARNRGLAVARGAFVSFLDADDLFAPQKIARQLEVLAQRPKTVVVCGLRRFRDAPSGRVWLHETEPPPCESMSTRDVALLRNDQMAIFTTALFPTEELRSLGGWMEGLVGAEDWELWLRSSRSLVVAAVREPLYFYRKHAASLTQQSRLDDVLELQLSLIDREKAAGRISAADASRAAREKLLWFAHAAQWRREPRVAVRAVSRGLLRHGGMADPEYYRTIVRMASRAASAFLAPRADERGS